MSGWRSRGTPPFPPRPSSASSASSPGRSTPPPSPRRTRPAWPSATGRRATRWRTSATASRTGSTAWRWWSSRSGGYRLEWQGGHRTRDEVVLRELPKPGSLLNVQELRKAIARLMATGLLAEPPRVSLAPGEKPDEAVVVLGLKEARTGLFQPAIGWSSLEGWSGSLAFKETNLFGLAHQVSLDLAFIQNDARDNLSFSAAYTVPWLYLDYLDLKEVRTSLAFSLYSTPIGNTKLLDGTTDTGWEYTERRTGASLSLSRPLSRDLSNLRTSLGLSLRRSTYLLEVYDPNAPCDATGADTSPPATPRAPAPTRTPPTCAPSSRTPAGPSAWTPPWPTWTWTTPGSAPRGTRRASPPASASPCPTQAGGASSSPWWPRARPTCPWTRKSARPSPSASPRGPSWATRRKASASTSPEAAPRPSSSGATRTGSTGASPSPPRAWSTATTSASPPKGAPTSTASSSPTWASPTTPGVKWGAGIGVQLDLDVFGALLPSLRLDYAFSPESPTGRIHFRIGPMF